MKAAALLLTMACAAPAFAQITRGAISGTVRDTGGAVVAGVSVTVTRVDTNVARRSLSDALGFYRVAALDPGRYVVRAEFAGFSAAEARDIGVRSATDTKVDIQLKVAAVGEVLTVTQEVGGVELNKTSPTVGLTSTARQVVELPLSADRNVSNLIALTANAIRTTGQGTYAVNGQRSRNNNYMLDGSDNNDISVTISNAQVVPEAVAEFQVLTNPYSAEFGRNSGAQVNVVTRSGTNVFRGEAWDYYTTSELYSLTNLEKASGLMSPARFNRNQLGASLGGPVFRDRTFFFLLYQYDAQRPGPTLGPTTRMPTPAGYAALQGVPLGAGQSAASREAVLQRLSFLQDVYASGVTLRNLRPTLVNGIPIETGEANVPLSSPSTWQNALARVDHRLGGADNLTFRYLFDDRAFKNAASNCVFGPIFCGNGNVRSSNLAGSEIHVFGPSMLNEVRFSWVRRDIDQVENDPDSPTASIAGLFTVGGASNYPQGRLDDAFQLSDTLTWGKGRHTLRAGVDVRYNRVRNWATFNSKGTFSFNSLQDCVNNVAVYVAQALQTASYDARQWQTSFFVQDDLRATPDLTLNLGLRYELSEVPLDMFGATDPESLAARVPGPPGKDRDNWAPRVGLAWSPRNGGRLLGDGRTVLRGGFGIGYDVIFYNLLTVNASNYPRVVVIGQFDVANLYPERLTGSASPVFDPLAGYTNSPSDLQNPDARYWSLTVQREISDVVVELGYTASRSGHGINQVQMNPSLLTAEQAALVAAARSASAIPSAAARRLYPQYGSRLLIPAYVGPGGDDVEARAQYDAAIVSIHKRFSKGWLAGAAYTYSRFLSNNDASLSENGTDGSSQRPQSSFDYEAEWSRSQFDRPHRFVVSWIWEIPGPRSGALGQVLGGWQVSGVTQGQSGRPFTVFTGVDSNGDGATPDRPDRNGSCGVTWDDEHKGFTNSGCYTTPLGNNNLPLTSALGDGNAPRNSERSAPTWNTDLSLLKRFPMGRRQLLIRADVFNAFNQDSYGIPVIVMTSPSFGLNANDWGRRTITLSAKLVW